jgi:hypothetical protein
MKCKICEVRKPRRYCPGVRADICAPCCGNEREVTVDCPLDCEYLREGRLHEKRPDINPADFPNQDIRVTEKFLREQEPLLIFIGSKLLEAALETPGAVDGDVRDAMESLIRTYRTLETGLYYETRPTSPVAGNVHARLQEAIQELRKKLSEQGTAAVRDADVLGIVVFLERLQMQNNNGRKRGRAFIDYLRTHFPEVEKSAKPQSQSLIQV